MAVEAAQSPWPPAADATTRYYTKGRLVRPPFSLTLNTGNFHLDDHGLQLQLDLQSAHAAHVPFFTLPFRFQRFHLCSPPRPAAAVHLTHTLSLTDTTAAAIYLITVAWPHWPPPPSPLSSPDAICQPATVGRRVTRRERSTE